MSWVEQVDQAKKISNRLQFLFGWMLNGEVGLVSLPPLLRAVLVRAQSVPAAPPAALGPQAA